MLDYKINTIANSLKSEQAKTLKIEERLEKESTVRLGPEHMDADSIQIFPIPLVILGGKYDIFQVITDICCPYFNCKCEGF